MSRALPDIASGAFGAANQSQALPRLTRIHRSVTLLIAFQQYGQLGVSNLSSFLIVSLSDDRMRS